MKAFTFRLDQAMRWRATQVEVERSRVAVASQLVRQIQDEIGQHRAAISAGSGQLSQGGNIASSLVHWAAFQDRTGRRIKALETNRAEAEKALAVQLQLLVEADRRLKLLENLKKAGKAEWQADFGRELEAFAGETYLFRLQSKNALARSGVEH